MTRTSGPSGAVVPAPSPPSSPTRRSRAMATRQALLVAAGERFAAAGYHATSLSDLLEDSRASKGALYFHFSSKQDLALAVVAAMTDSWCQVLPAVRTRAGDPLEALVLLTDVVIARLDSPVVRGGARLLLDEVLPSPTLGDVNGTWETQSTELLESAATGGHLRATVAPEWVAHTVTTSLAGRRQLLAGAVGNALRDQMDDFWAGFLPLVSSEAWWAGWRARVWRQRPRPDFVGHCPGP